MEIKITGKIVLVTGAGTGIGRAIAKEFANAGGKVLIVGRAEETLKETASLNKNIKYLVADLTRHELHQENIWTA